jgi:hypothetical protein
MAHNPIIHSVRVRLGLLERSAGALLLRPYGLCGMNDTTSFVESQ